MLANVTAPNSTQTSPKRDNRHGRKYVKRIKTVVEVDHHGNRGCSHNDHRTHPGPTERPMKTSPLGQKENQSPDQHRNQCTSHMDLHSDRRTQQWGRVKRRRRNANTRPIAQHAIALSDRQRCYPNPNNHERCTNPDPHTSKKAKPKSGIWPVAILVLWQIGHRVAPQFKSFNISDCLMQ